MNGAAPIIDLLFGGGPPNVAWFIVAVVVYSIYGMRRTRSAADISEKRRVAVSPFFIHADSSPTPQCISRQFLVVAALLDVAPRSIFFGPTIAALTVVFSAKASATFRYPSAKCACEHKRFISAFASTEPTQEYPAVWALPNYGEKPESLTSQILLSHSSIIGDSQWALAE